MSLWSYSFLIKTEIKNNKDIYTIARQKFPLSGLDFSTHIIKKNYYMR